MNKSLQYQIDSALTTSGCAMISPQSRYFFNPETGKHMKSPRDTEKVIQLEQSISKRMREIYTKNISDALESFVPVGYIDCMIKGDNTVLLHLFKETIKNLPEEQKKSLLKKVIGRNSIVISSQEDWKQYVTESNLDSEGMYEYYNQLFQRAITDKEKAQKDFIMRCESDITFDGLCEYLKELRSSRMHIFVDNIQGLTLEDQTYLNTILYARGMVGIGNDNGINIKINNGGDHWNTRMSATGHRIQSPHDYSETTIREEDVI